MTTKIHEEKEDKEEKQDGNGQEAEEREIKREIVIPGEIMASGQDYLPGDWTKREKNDIVALRFGLSDKFGRLVKIIPLSGTYIPRKGNVVIGKVTDISFNGWIMDIDAPYPSFLSAMECSRFVNKNDLSECYDIGDMIVCKVFAVKRKGVDLTARGRNLGKLEDGIVIYVNSNKVPRVIGKEGSMINLIKKETDCDIIVGQNGVIWVKGARVEDELFAKKAILFVTEKSFIEGLTDKVKEWFEKNKKSEKKLKEEKE